MPKYGEKPENFSMTVDSYQTYSPNTQMKPYKLFDVKMTSEGSENPFTNFVGLVKEAWTMLRSKHAALDFDVMELRQLASEILNPDVDQILFKQMPTGNAEQAACQSIMHSRTPIDTVHSGCLYTHEFEFTLYQNDQFPLQDMFGIPVGSQQVLLPFNVLFDFHQEEAIEIASNMGATPKQKKVAILGGGLGAVAAAYGLTSKLLSLLARLLRYAIVKIEHGVEEVAEEVEHVAEDVVGAAARTAAVLLQDMYDLLHKLQGAEQDAEALYDDLKVAMDKLLQHVRASIQTVEEWLEIEIAQHNTLRRLILGLEWVTVSIIGFIEDGVLSTGSLDDLDQYEYRAWLAKHGASDLVTRSTVVQALYDYILAYPNGDAGSSPEETSHKGDLGAEVANRCLLMTFFGYSGSIMWKMNSGMGDIIFGPIYETLKKRGVKFQFFTDIKELQLTADKQDIGEITYDLQVELQAGLTAYNPLYTIKYEENGQPKTLPVWPVEPLYDQLEQGAELEQLKAEGKNVDLESAWTGWESVKPDQKLVKGVDFDLVVLGISVAGLPDMTTELRDQSNAWEQMLDHANTTQVLAAQLWLNKTLTELGWTLGPPVIDGYVEPFNTWASMDQTLPTETWPEDNQPVEISYFCGVLQEANPIPPYSDHDFPRRQHERVRNDMIAWLQHNIQRYWPHAVGPDGFDWNILVDIVTGTQGEERFNSQFWTAEINPTQRYVLSVHDTIQYRLALGNSGFNNLYLAGDWTKNGFNYGAVEPTVISGLQAS